MPIAIRGLTLPLNCPARKAGAPMVRIRSQSKQFRLPVLSWKNMWICPERLLCTATANATDQDYIHLRYADMLLMYAEAKNEVSGPDATVYEALNDVRGRTGINMPSG